MDNFKTVIAVIVVLGAFSGFQLISNQALKRSIKQETSPAAQELAAVRAQVTAMDDKVQALKGDLDRLKVSTDQLSTAMAGAKARSEEAEAKAGEVAKSIDVLQKKLTDLHTAINAAASSTLGRPGADTKK